MSNRVQSTVRVYFDQLGYGFITNPSAGDDRDIYACGNDVPHRAGLGKRLVNLEAVEFEIEERARGPKAVNITFPVIVPQTQGLES